MLHDTGRDWRRKFIELGLQFVILLSHRLELLLEVSNAALRKLSLFARLLGNRLELVNCPRRSLRHLALLFDSLGAFARHRGDIGLEVHNLFLQHFRFSAERGDQLVVLFERRLERLLLLDLFQHGHVQLFELFNLGLEPVPLFGLLLLDRVNLRPDVVHLAPCSLEHSLALLLGQLALAVLGLQLLIGQPHLHLELAYGTRGGVALRLELPLEGTNRSLVLRLLANELAQLRALGVDLLVQGPNVDRVLRLDLVLLDDQLSRSLFRALPELLRLGLVRGQLGLQIRFEFSLDLGLERLSCICHGLGVRNLQLVELRLQPSFRLILDLANRFTRAGLGLTPRLSLCVIQFAQELTLALLLRLDRLGDAGLGVTHARLCIGVKLLACRFKLCGRLGLAPLLPFKKLSPDRVLGGGKLALVVLGQLSCAPCNGRAQQLLGLLKGAPLCRSLDVPKLRGLCAQFLLIILSRAP